jgi:hypothetical protein
MIVVISTVFNEKLQVEKDSNGDFFVAVLDKDLNVDQHVCGFVKGRVEVYGHQDQEVFVFEKEEDKFSNRETVE